MAAPVAPRGAVPWSGARSRRRLARPPVLRRPWPVAAVPDAVVEGGAVPDGVVPDGVVPDGVVPGGVVWGAAPISGVVSAALPVPPTVVLPDVASARTDVTGAPVPVVAARRTPRALVVMRPVVAGPSRRAPIRHGHVPGTPLRAHRPVWGPPQPAR